MKTITDAKEKLKDQQAKYSKEYFEQKDKDNWKNHLTKHNKDLYFQPKTKSSKGGLPKVSDERLTEM